MTKETGNESSQMPNTHRAMYECARAFEQALDEKQMLQRVCDIFVEVCGFRTVWIGDIGPEPHKTIRLIAQAGSVDALAENKFASAEAYSDDTASIALRTGKRCRSHNALSLLIKSEDRLFGVITFSADNPTQFEPNAIEGLDIFSNLLARELADLRSQRQRLETEETLREQESGLRQLIDAIPQHILILSPDGLPLFRNKANHDYHGLTLEEIQSPDTALKSIHPDDVRRVLLEANRGHSGKVPFETQFRMRRKDGQFRWFLIRHSPLRDQHGNIVRWYSSATDIEALKQTTQELERTEKELQQVIDLAPQHVAVLAADGSRVYMNQVGLKYLGLALDEWRDDKLRVDFVHPDDRERALNEPKDDFLTGRPHEIEMRLRRNDGTYRWFLFRLNPLRDEQGQITRWYAAGTDIEDRKHTEERLHHENIALREEIDKASMFEEIVGASPALQAVLSRVSKVAPTDSSVLLTGETGTGKELVARAIHRHSRRSSRAFVSVNCAAIPRDLIASELFGHEKGSFTGALQRRVGKFELAEGGTIFLDEIGELPTETQIALLRVLQEREFDRVGGNQPIRVEVRVIAATNRDLEASIAAGAFRRDLFYRLNVFPIEIPPLRERKEDIPMLVEYFIDRYARKTGKRMRSIDKKTLELLQSYSWPGNIRELQNIIERSVIVCETEIFSVDQSWLSVRSSQAQPGRGPFSKGSTAQEKASIEAALAQTGGRISGSSGAAAILGVPPSTLESKIRSLKINKFRFKSG